MFDVNRPVLQSAYEASTLITLPYHDRCIRPPDAVTSSIKAWPLEKHVIHASSHRKPGQCAGQGPGQRVAAGSASRWPPCSTLPLRKRLGHAESRMVRSRGPLTLSLPSYPAYPAHTELERASAMAAHPGVMDTQNLRWYDPGVH